MDTTTFLALVLPGLATGLGGIALLLVRPPIPPRLLAAMLGFTGGVMLAAVSFSLLVPAVDAAGALWEVVAGFAAGCAVMVALDRFIPHAHEDVEGAPVHEDSGRPPGRGGTAQGHDVRHRAGHPQPARGLAVGVAFGLGGTEAGLALATGVVEPPAAVAAFYFTGLPDAVLAGGLAFARGRDALRRRRRAGPLQPSAATSGTPRSP